MSKRKTTIDPQGFTVTAGVTSDGKYSLAVQEVNGIYCLCVHKCEVHGGLHYSSMDDESLVTYINPGVLRNALEYADSKNALLRDNER